jgi:predicted DCC family thiol-disulfide oxidoreductase YuxK
MHTPELTLYFDGQCPFCVAEMRRLRSWDHLGRLGFVDIAEPGFDAAPLGVSLAALNRELHSWTATGQCLVGIDSMIAAYTLVGRGWYVIPLRVHGTREICQVLYRVFAQNRQRISRWLGYKSAPVCTNGSCDLSGNPFLK